MPRPGKLTPEQQTFVVTSLACFDPPKVIQDGLRENYEVTISLQSIEGYDPNKTAGAKLAAKWRTLFAATRAAFIEDTADIGISHKAVRLRTLERMAKKAESMGNMALAAQLLEQAAKECGNSYTNKRELSRPDGGAVVEINQSMNPREAAEAYAATLDSDS